MLRNKFYDSLKKILFAFVAMMFVAPAFSANLPAGYTELEYIESTGTQWIDTGYQGNQNSGAYMKYRYTTLDGSLGRVFGSRINSSSTQFAYIGTYSGKAEPSTNFYVASNGTTVHEVKPLDTDIHTVAVNVDNTKKMYFDNELIGTGTSDSFNIPYNVRIFCAYNNSSYSCETKAAIYELEIYDNGVLTHKYIPARRNSDGVIGMYNIKETNTANAFRTNAGTGVFSAGPDVLDSCRNLLDISTSTTGSYIGGDGSLTANSEFAYSSLIPVEPNTKYIVSGHSNTSQSNRRLHAYDANGNWLAQLGMASVPAAGTDYTIPVTTTAGTKYVKLSYRIDDTNVQVEQGETLTDYVPYCSDKIKIATTKYNEDAFANLVTTLNSAITKVTNIVDTTVAQATSIGTLATTKQDRPADGDCPPGRKCLLVTGTDGKPHWYLIQE